MYRKKPSKEILFSNLGNEQKENPPQGSNIFNRINFQSNIKIRVIYKFNDYIKLHLCKILPNEQITIAYQDSIIFGPQSKCREVLSQISKEFKTKTYKKMKFKVIGDIDQLEFHLNDKYDFKIYRPKVLGLIAQQLAKVECYASECSSFLEQVKEGIFLLRIDKQRAEQCVSDIVELLRLKQRQRVRPIAEQEDEQMSCEMVEQRNIYDLMKQSEKKARRQDKSFEFSESQMSREYMLNETTSIEEQLNISQTNSSNFVQNLKQQQQHFTNNQKCSKKMSQSFT